ncbi:hypothetical protein RS130_21515 [Paraglaciecola aquimarina]|uniref:Polysaccharide export outer membrane protein n=1 Tax=Paraglaciecola aquimarina TaxID=1235557 RepID=A0ABU3T1G6_9ALTE|nr:hypothetical protein [Paraglaciecola aquimarina]MDU0356124.1 hypothetical protein [Paraglaciecola aquimarina]
MEELRQQIISSNVSGNQNVKTVDYQDAKLILDELLQVKPIGRLVVDMFTVMSGEQGADLVLKDGDKLFVPNISPFVSVIGEVFVPTTHVLDDSLTLEQYISRSGGVTERADASKVYIVKSNGSVKIPDNSFWFDGTKIELEYRRYNCCA